jgi:lysophospholipase L1-like esterase
MLFLLLLAGCSGNAVKVARIPAIPEIPSYRPYTNAYKSEFDYFRLSDKKSFPQTNAILFTGSSSIRMWFTLSNDMAPLPVLNRGFGGAQVADTVYYFDSVVAQYRPGLIVYYCGGNDIAAGKKGKTVFAHFRVFLQRVESNLPGTKVCFLSYQTAPVRVSDAAETAEYNRMAQELAATDTNLLYFDLLPATTGPGGALKPEIWSADRLHMNQKGYALWTEALKPYLTGLWGK